MAHALSVRLEEYLIPDCVCVPFTKEFNGPENGKGEDITKPFSTLKVKLADIKNDILIFPR